MAAVVGTEPLVELDYAAAVDGASLVEHATVAEPARARLLVAAPRRTGAPHRQLRRADRRRGHRSRAPRPPRATDEVRPRQLERIA